MSKALLLAALPFAALADSGMELRRSLNDTPHGWTLAPDPMGDGMVERLEVRPGDCGENGVYRSFISRHGHPAPTQIAYFRDISRAATREGLK